MKTDSTVEEIDDLRSGRPEALSRLYDRHSSLMYGVAMRILQDEGEAQDALQEAWVQAWRRRDGFNADRGSLASWLVTIVRSRALDRTRRRSARDRMRDQAAAEPEPARLPASDPHEDVVRADLRERLAQALASLDRKHRTSLELAYFEGLTQSQIAERLGTPLGTVKYWMRQALMQMRETLPAEVWP